MMISSEPAAVAAGEEVNHSQQQQVAMIVPETCAEGTHCQKEQNSIGDLQGLEFICDHEGYRYYKNRETGKQCALDSLGYWYVFDEQSGAFTPLNAVQSTDDQNEEKKTKSENQVDHKLKNAEKYGITFDHNGHPCYPKNEKGLFVLPKDDKGLPFFPVDDRGRPIFPYNYSKDESTFPVDDTEEPIFPRNELNKPLVPTDKNGEPIFPIDADGNYIFPFDENNCPIPALTADGKSVLPKDVYGNFVIPQDREGKPLIHIASDGVTPISIAEWKQWKTYYREQTRNFYQQQQQQQTQQIGTEGANANYQQANSMFHPLNLEQQSVYFAADMEMLQMTRRVRPEDVDLPNMQAQVNSQSQSAVAAATETTNSTSAVKDNVNGTAGFDPKQPKRNKFLEAQLKSVKKVIPPPQTKTEEVKKVEKRQEKDIEKETDKKRYFPAKKDDRKRPADRRSQDRSPKRSRRRSSSRSSYSSRSVKQRNRSGRRDRRHRARSPSYSSSSSSSYSSSSSRSRTRTPLSSSRENRQRDRVKEEEEETIRSRIISRAMTTSASAPDSVHSQAQIDNDLGPEEYGPKPPAQLGNGGSDMELSEGEEETKTAEAEKEVEAEATEYEELGIGINKREATVDTAKKMEQKTQEKNEVKAVVKSTAVEGSYNVKEVLKSESLELIRLCKVQEKEKYDQVKLLIAELEVERSVHKRNWAQLREAERRLERKTGTDNLSSSDDS